MAAAKKKKVLTYKGKPVYRKGNKLFYGNLEDPLILMLEIAETSLQMLGRDLWNQINQ